MPQVKLKVLQTAAGQIIKKLQKDSLDAKIHDDPSKDKQQIALLTTIKVYLEELTSGEIPSEKRTKQLADKINEVLDQFSELVRNKDLKRQINDAYKKRIKSKNEKKYTLKSNTAERLNNFLSMRNISGSFDYSINEILNIFDESALFNNIQDGNAVDRKRKNDKEKSEKKKSYHALKKSLTGNKGKGSGKKNK